MKFWRNPAALLMVFHPETTHTGNHSTPKDVKNEGRPGYVYENKVMMDKMSEIISDICARLKPLLQKMGVCSARIAAKFRRPRFREGCRKKRFSPVIEMGAVKPAGSLAEGENRCSLP